MTHTRLLGYVTAGLVALSTSASTGLHAQSTTWRIDPTPLVRVGTADGDTLTELVGLSSSLVFADGSTVAALGRNRRLVFFNAEGRLATSVGRRGGGPGEFSGAVALARWSGDSLVVWDASANRWSIFTASGTFARQLPATDGRDHDRRAVDVAPGLLVFAHDAARGVPAWVGPVADSLRRARVVGDVPRAARLDPQDLLWIRSATDSTRWSVYTAAATLVASLSIPGGGEIVDVLLDRVLVRTVDDDGFEFLSTHRLSGRPRTIAAARPLPPRSTAADRAELVSLGKNLVMAQERFFSDAVTYSRRADQLKLELPADIRLTILSADNRHWRGAVSRPSTGGYCLINVGGPPTIGWSEGLPICSR